MKKYFKIKRNNNLNSDIKFPEYNEYSYKDNTCA